MLNAIPIIGWLIDFVLRVSLAVPFWLVWQHFGVGGRFLPNLPEIYQEPGFWNIVGVFMCAGILKTVFFPHFSSSSSSSSKGQ